MRRRSDPWTRLTMDSLRLAAEAQQVIGLRMMTMAFGGPKAVAEAELMVSEKIRAAGEAQLGFMTDVMTGAGHLGPQRAVARYRRKVRANQRRLSKG